MREFLVHSVFFGAAVSLVGYEVGLLLKRKFKMAIFNPLLIAILCVMAILTVGDISYDDYNQGAQYLSYLLTPATVCLAVPLYQQLNLLKKNLKAVAAGILSGVLTSILSVLGLSYLFGLSHDMYVTLLPKSITTAIAIGVSDKLGGNHHYRSTGKYNRRCGVPGISDQRTSGKRAGTGNRFPCNWNCKSHGDGAGRRSYE